MGSFIVVVILLGFIYGIYWYYKLDGATKATNCFDVREKRRLTYKTLPEDMEFLKAEINRLKGHTGLEDEEEKETELAE